MAKNITSIKLLPTVQRIVYSKILEEKEINLKTLIYILSSKPLLLTAKEVRDSVSILEKEKLIDKVFVRSARSNKHFDWMLKVKRKIK